MAEDLATPANPPRTFWLSRVFCAILALSVALAPKLIFGETCTTQSAMDPVQRAAIADAARSIANMVQTNNTAALHGASIGEVAKDFNALQYLVASTAPKISGGLVQVDQIYLLDAANLPKNPDGSNPDAQFFCSLNRTTMETEFLIPALPPGRYSFVILNILPTSGSASEYRLSLLLRQDQGHWLLAGLYPRPATAAGHDGLWYWRQARQMVAAKQSWNAWLYYRAAEKLLQPADFVLSSHLDKLKTEAQNAAPAVLSEGVSVDAPLVVRGSDGVDYRFTGLGVNDSLAQSSLDIEAHLHIDSALDPIAARKRNDAAAAALVDAYPELRKPFHGVWIYAEAPGQSAFATEEPMADIK